MDGTRQKDDSLDVTPISRDPKHRDHGHRDTPLTILWAMNRSSERRGDDAEPQLSEPR